eukprot:12424382-Karenia_brevis.AAC.1
MANMENKSAQHTAGDVTSTAMNISTAFWACGVGGHVVMQEGTMCECMCACWCMLVLVLVCLLACLLAGLLACLRFIMLCGLCSFFTQPLLSRLFGVYNAPHLASCSAR